MFKSLSTSLIARGILFLAAGVTALAWPGPTALVLVLIVGTWAIPLADTGTPPRGQPDPVAPFRSSAGAARSGGRTG
jgi:hypothetical protein